ncbi:hypothetical protein GCM10007147_30910 [Nocardiopsis kunsanensis]|uniref:Uncharacterized protein n=1 Tax=Nocardiopsis kunsanensis TaxID=141693 RepID=A0A919CJE2_9ACTN|nr:hypothetical protein GCM10007147_30910 [Nocardiopsis kunsanensis]
MYAGVSETLWALRPNAGACSPRPPGMEELYREDMGNGLPEEPVPMLISHTSPMWGPGHTKGRSRRLRPLVMLVGDTGFEPVTSTVSRSSPISGDLAQCASTQVGGFR